MRLSRLEPTHFFASVLSLYSAKTRVAPASSLTTVVQVQDTNEPPHLAKLDASSLPLELKTPQPHREDE